MRTLANKDAFGLAAELLRQGERVTLRVEGQSMLPFFRSGSVVRLRPLQPGDIARGQVVLGRTAAGTYVIHRIIGFDQRAVTLLGDGNWLGTERIPHDELYGIIDCGALHLFLARIWLWMRPVRRYPLAILRRIFRH